MDNYIRSKYLALGFVRDIDLYGAHSACEAAALGQKQPLNSIQILASEWPLLGKSGHSPLGISGESSGCFRPQAAIQRLNGSKCHLP